MTTSTPLLNSAPPTSATTPLKTTLVHAALWIVGAALLRALLSRLVPLLPDETYYWSWTTRLAPGYFDHPPGIALVISLGTMLFGDTAAGVRAGAAFAALVTHIAAAFAAWFLAGKGCLGAEAARRVAMLFTVIPIATLGLVLATPDVALFAAAMVALAAVDRALASPVRSWAAFGWWTLAGVCLGAAFVSKYTAVLLPAGLVVACLVYPALRVRFREAGPWWAAGIALLLFAPVVAWNHAHDWVSFRFQLVHGFGSNARDSVWARELEMIGGQFALVTPIVFVMLLIAVWSAIRGGWHGRHDAQPTDVVTRRFALGVVSMVPLVFFAVSALRKPVEANWPALIYPSALLLLATDTSLLARGTKSARWFARGAVLAAVLLAIAALQVWRPLLPLAPRKDPIARAHGWQALADSVQRARSDAFFNGVDPHWVAADRYQDASELWFYLPDKPQVFSLNLGGRENQYSLWNTAYNSIRIGDNMVAVFDANPAGDSLGVRVSRWFLDYRRDALVVRRRGTAEVGHRRVWLYRSAIATPVRPNPFKALSSKP